MGLLFCSTDLTATPVYKPIPSPERPNWTQRLVQKMVQRKLRKFKRRQGFPTPSIASADSSKCAILTFMSGDTIHVSMVQPRPEGVNVRLCGITGGSRQYVPAEEVDTVVDAMGNVIYRGGLTTPISVQTQQQRQTNNLATLTLLLGVSTIVSLFIAALTVPAFLIVMLTSSLGGLIIGTITASRIKRGKRKGMGRTITGLALSAIPILFILIGLFIFLLSQ